MDKEAKMTSIAIMVVAGSLDREVKTREPIPGNDTATACNTALDFAVRMPDSHIVITAGDAGYEWGNLWMAVLMRTHIISRNDFGESGVQVVVQKAEVFTTSGEMRALAAYVRDRPHIKEVIIVVKFAHAHRAKYLCDYWFHEYGIAGVKISVVPSSLRVTLFQVIWEIGAWPKNLLWRALGKL